ncbi:MAG: hypothetical protein OEZ54_09985 [Gemmatimonadota bacterium]|nr:hypothetical protein [Gemmatimonadota bacterium]
MSKPEPLFCTAINCIDGRVQEPVASLAKKHFGVDYADMITQPAPAAVIEEQRDAGAMTSMITRAGISIAAHDSKGIAIAAHHDCAATPASDETQKKALKTARKYLQREFPDLEIVAVWVDAELTAHLLDA